MPSLPDLPAGLTEAMQQAAFEGVSHLQGNVGPFVFQVKLFRRDPQQPVLADIEVVSKRWRVGEGK